MSDAPTKTVHIVREEYYPVPRQRKNDDPERGLTYTVNAKLWDDYDEARIKFDKLLEEVTADMELRTGMAV